jgi:HD-GYP domain-containing protein (c-di-GMP phosphodiesterase class II)
MSGILQKAPRRFPLHVHISVLLALLLIASGSLLGFFHYNQASQIIFSSSERLFRSIHDDVQQDLRQTYQPIRQLLDLLVLAPSAHGSDRTTRLRLLPVMSQALRDNHQLAQVYIGSPDGDFFMVRALRNASTRERFQAPEAAAFQIWSVERTDEQIDSRHLFYDDTLQLLEDRPVANETYDPRERTWYRSAMADTGQIVTRPYLFFSTGELGTTLARQIGESVAAADLTLADLSATLTRHQVTPSTELVLLDSLGRTVAYHDPKRLLQENDQGEPQRVLAADLHPSIAAVLAQPPGHTEPAVLLLDRRRWVVSLTHLAEGDPNGLDLALLVPEDELLADAYRIRWQGALITLGVLLLSLPLGWLASRIMTRPLTALEAEAEAIRGFDFSSHRQPRSMVLEIDNVSQAMARMKHNLASFMEISSSLSAQTHFSSLLELLLRDIAEIAEVDGGILYLADEDGQPLRAQQLILDGTFQDPNHFGLNRELPDAKPDWLELPFNGGDSETRSMGFDAAGMLQSLMHAMDSPRINLLSCGLRSRQGNTLGVLVLVQRDQGLPASRALFRSERIAFIEAISGVAGMCIDGQRLLENQKRLMDSFIQLLAGAIDAKSPYTGGHCQRVPELTLMLAKAAARDEHFPGYQPDMDDWEALRTAAWLHDCGKVTTPEYVVDKATKLEALTDRIHEVRMRFEVLKRDAWIDYWQTLHAGGDEPALREARDRQLATLDEEFAFVASANLGGEFMNDEDIARLERIAERRWLRTLDERLGLSRDELERKQRIPPSELPCFEPLLADKVDHLIERAENERLAADNPWGFKVDTPEYKFNRGELHNLRIRRGTLTAEERYIINGHMLQTIRMLETLPFPARLRQVPEIAGGHHEKMDGSGYPRRLTGEQLSLPARMMAIADIFEALTAADRPYKPGKRLSESLAIMLDMCRSGHIDAQLFELFIREGIYREYAKRFLAAEQQDAVDEAALLERIRA